MKKITAIISAAIATLVSAAPAFGGVGGTIKPCSSNVASDVGGGPCNLDSSKFGAIVSNIVSTLVIIAVIIAVLFLVSGGIKWIMSGGDKAKVESARNTIIGGIVGLVLVFLAYFLISLIARMFGVDISSLTLPTIGSTTTNPT